MILILAWNGQWSRRNVFLLLLVVCGRCPRTSGFVPIRRLFPLDDKVATTMSNVMDQEHEDGYFSHSLSPRQERDLIHRETIAYYNDDDDQLRPPWRRRLVRFLQRRLFPPQQQQQQPGALILVKSGESTWRKRGIFSGWSNAPKLTPQGEQECRHAARLLLESGYQPDVIYTSMLNRAIHSSWIINREMDAIFLPVFKTWRLNERMYGSIQGLSKKETALKFGQNVVQAWRQSLKGRPPPVSKSCPSFPGHDRRYANIDPKLLPTSESLLDCMKRQQPLWKYRIAPELQRGNNVLVVGHSNSLRGLVKIIDDVADDRMEDISFPPGIPVVYKFHPEMKPVRPVESDELVPKHTSGVFLEQPGLLKEALRRQAEWQASVPGAEGMALAPRVKRMTTLQESLMLLKKDKEMEEWAASHPTTQRLPKIQVFGPPVPVRGALELGSRSVDDSEFEEPTHTAAVAQPIIPNMDRIDDQRDAVVVIVRHGATPHNELSLFTGWEDPPLSEAGVEDAKRAGKLLKRHGFEFDVVYTSWLGRAIETAWYILEELDSQWLPIVKSWRLNERHYGQLTGRSKKMIGNIYGQDQLKKWRRGFDIPPPKSSSYSFSYPGNDYRRTKYVKDLRISVMETLCRSIEARRFQIHRKFPKSESLKMCMDRTIPFYTQKIVPEAVAKGKRVLITSHENAIRGILMHLCEIPKECMNDLHLPNGLPLIYNVRRKCISLLDDGTGRDPMEVHDFGSAAQYLFRPCEITDEDFERMAANASRHDDLGSIDSGGESGQTNSKKEYQDSTKTFAK